MSVGLINSEVADYQAVINPAENDLSQLKERLKKNFWERSSETLFSDLPNLNLEHAFNVILSWDDSYKDLIDYLSFLVEDRGYKMTPMHSVMFDIIKDFAPPYSEERSQFTLTNESLPTLMQEKGVEVTEENLSQLRALSLKIRHPRIYTPAETSVKSTEVAVNLLWIQENPFQSTASAFDRGDKTENCRRYLGRIKELSDLRPDLSVQLWIDSALVTEEAFNKTIALIRTFKEETGVNLKLRDVRSLTIDSDLMGCFHPAMPVYFRVDLLKALIPYEAMKNPDHPTFCEVRDVDIKPNTLPEVYNQNTMLYLEKTGFLLATYRKMSQSYENSFLIFDVKNSSYQQDYEDSFITSLKKKIGYQKTVNQYKEFQGYSLKRNTFVGEDVYGYYEDFLYAREINKKNITVCVEAPLSSHSERWNHDNLYDRRNERCRFSKEGAMVTINGHRQDLDFSKWEARALTIPEDL
jgi:hypothetical protein